MLAVTDKVKGLHWPPGHQKCCYVDSTKQFSTEFLSYYFIHIYLVSLTHKFLIMKDLGLYIIELCIRPSIGLGQDYELTDNT